MNNRVSPTAYYTSFIWIKNGLSDPALGSRLGNFFYYSLKPFLLTFSNSFIEFNKERKLLFRHKTINKILTQAIETGEVRQVFEIASGLSPRGYRFAKKYSDIGLKYIEGDLPLMAQEKQHRLQNNNLSPHNHLVVDLDILNANGSNNFEKIIKDRFDPDIKTAIITEGLLMYFNFPLVQSFWKRFAATLSQFNHGLYLSDIGIDLSTSKLSSSKIYYRFLSAFVKQNVYQHFKDPSESIEFLKNAGFNTITLHNPDGKSAEKIDASVIEAWT